MKRIVWILMMGLLLSGCSREKAPVYRVVTGVQVEYRQNTHTLSRTYTENPSIQSILTYLRILRPYGPVIPEEGSSATCRITLHYSHGPDSIIEQLGNGYLRRDNGSWERIDTARASLLYPLLYLLPSDKKDTADPVGQR